MSAELTVADRSDSVMYCGDLDGATFKEARFAGAVLRKVDLSLANLMEIDLSGWQAFTGINDIQVSLRKSMRAPMKWVSSDTASTAVLASLTLQGAIFSVRIDPCPCSRMLTCVRQFLRGFPSHGEFRRG